MATTVEIINTSTLFGSVYDNSHLNAVLIMDTDGTILRANKAFEKSFGYPEQELQGKNFAHLFTVEDIADEKPQQELAKVLATGQADDKNYLVHKTKGKLWVSGESVIAAAESGRKLVVKIVQDINDQKEGEFTIHRVVDFGDNILMSIDDVVVVVNKSFKILKSNQAFTKLFKPGTPPTIETDFNAFIYPYDQSGLLTEKTKKLVEEGEHFTNVEIPFSIGKDDYVYSITGSSIVITDATEGILLVMHDITFQKIVEKEREDIIGFVAHELRNPLSNILLCNEMIKEVVAGKNPLLMDNLLQRSKDNIARLNGMITELYEATKIQSGNFKLKIAAFDFEEMLAEAIDTVKILHPDFYISVSGIAGTIEGDRYRLIQVITNYVGNGIKYSNGTNSIVIKVVKENNRVTVAVTDKGLGIAKDQLPYIFERFFRAEKTKNIEGIGLGLFFCSRIIGAHHGKVWAESSEGEGSTFYFSLPAHNDSSFLLTGFVL